MSVKPVFILEPRPQVCRIKVPGNGALILHPEQVILQFGHGQTVDLGAMCYLSRETGAEIWKRRGSRHEGRVVVLSSFDKSRCADVRKVITHIEQELLASGKRSTTVAAQLRSFVFFMEWADANGHSDALGGGATTKEAIAGFIAHQRERVRAGAITCNTGALQQGAVIDFVSELVGDDTLGRGLSLLTKSSRLQQPTVPPSDDSQAKVLALCESFFAGIQPFLLENAPFPHKLAMPKYLAGGERGLWIFPTLRWCTPPHAQEVNHSGGRNYLSYDYANGSLRTSEEIEKLRPMPSNQSCSSVKRAATNLVAANSDCHHRHRIKLGDFAEDTFVMMFMAQTGMNLAQVRDLRWDDAYSIGAERQRFRAIKARAGGREVFFEIPVGFLGTFKRYLQLREYLCAKQPSELLFPRMGTGTSLEKAYARLRRIDPQLPRILSRQWRAAKSDWLIRNTDVSTAALVLQNSEKTVLAAYAAGSEAGHLDEMTAFLGKVSAAVVSAGEVLERDTACAVGSCTDTGHPLSIQPLVPTVPDCKKMEGCLFCEKFRVHADERDTRKLLSCQYCVEQTSHFFRSEEKYQQVIGPVLQRIQQLLGEIAERDAAMVAKLTREVLEDGELDPFWASTMQMLMELGVVQ